MLADELGFLRAGFVLARIALQNGAFHKLHFVGRRPAGKILLHILHYFHQRTVGCIAAYAGTEFKIAGVFIAMNEERAPYVQPFSSRSFRFSRLLKLPPSA
jgi:hypothetical protein